MKLRFLGGADEVGASCTLVEIEGLRLLVDAGIRVGAPAGAQLPDLAALDETGPPDEILLTHAHTDHVGALPALVHDLPAEVPIRCTAPTQALARILLFDSLRIMKLAPEPELPLYADEAVEAVLGRMQTVPYLQTVPLGDGRLRATWIPSGHILGAASIYIEGQRESLYISGDVSLAPQRSIPGMVVPDCRPQVLVLESTYGNRRHADRAAQEAALARQVAETVEAGGKVLVPAFAVGRAQEVLLILARAMRRGEIPVFPVYADGMVRRVCAAYADFPESLSPALRRLAERGEPLFWREGVQAVGGGAERERVIAGPPCCIVASSGMLGGGPSVYYARHLVEGEMNLIAITGYQDEEAPGRALTDLAAGRAQGTLVLDGRRHEVRCRVETYALSAHADRDELAGLARRLGVEEALLVHGEEAARVALAGQLDAFLARGVRLPANGETHQIDAAARSARRYGGSTWHGLGGGRAFDRAALQAIATYLRETERLGPFRVQELAEIWCGSDAAGEEEGEALREVLAVDPQPFVADERRPYLYRLSVEEQVAGPWEVNRARARILAVLGEDAGLFRIGIFAEDGAMELAFHFPPVAQREHAAKLAALEKETGWRLQVRPTPHQERLFAAVGEVLPAGTDLRRAPALRLDLGQIEVDVALDAGEKKRASEDFAARTGYELVFKESGGAAAKASPAAGAWEINQAYAEIKAAFADKAHRPYKVGRKTDAEGAFIDVAFISPAVGQRYGEVLQALEERIGWRLQVRQAVHQQEIAALAQAVLPEGIGLQGAPRLYVGEGRVAVKVAAEPPDAEGLLERFYEETGFVLDIVVG